MRARLLIAATTLSILASACGKRVPRPANVPPDTPHVTWVLMYGDRDNPDREFACQSDPRTDCVLPVSRPDAQVFSDFHIYFHRAGGETRYEGTTNIGYLQGSSESHTSKANTTVGKNESITNQSVIGIVRSVPGTYDVTFAMTATLPGTGKTVPIRQTIQVAVK
jgi:hypothetical protein